MCVWSIFLSIGSEFLSTLQNWYLFFFEKQREVEMKKKHHELKSYGSMSQGSSHVHDEIVVMEDEDESTSKKDKKECCEEEERHSGDVSYVVFEFFFFEKFTLF